MMRATFPMVAGRGSMPTGVRAMVGALALVTAMASAAAILHQRALLFPEFGALAAGVLVYRLGPWRARAADIMVFPVLASLIGVGLNQTTLSPEIRWVVALGAILVLLRAGGSSMVPSISAALLPVLVGFTSLLYPLAVSVTTATLALLVLRHRRDSTNPGRPPQPSARLIVTYWVLGSIWGVAAISLGVKYAAAPPILVAAFEVMKASGKQAAPKAIVLALSLMAGVATHLVIASWPLDAACVCIVVWGLCRAGGVILPPAYALGLLPLLLNNTSDPRFLAAAVSGSLGLLAVVWLWSRVSSSTPALAAKPATGPRAYAPVSTD